MPKQYAHAQKKSHKPLKTTTKTQVQRDILAFLDSAGRDVKGEEGEAGKGEQRLDGVDTYLVLYAVLHEHFHVEDMCYSLQVLHHHHHHNHTQFLLSCQHKNRTHTHTHTQ